jgi:hypothetical protein
MRSTTHTTYNMNHTEWTIDRLALEIRSFLSKYAKVDADEGDYTSPDANELETAATEIENFGELSHIPNSSWESCGYHPYTSIEGREWHDAIKATCVRLVGW